MANIRLLEGEESILRRRCLEGAIEHSNVWRFWELDRNKVAERKWSDKRRGVIVEFPLLRTLLQDIPHLTPPPSIKQNIDSIIRFERRRIPEDAH